MNVVVVGSGIAGLTAALHADAAGHSVTVVTKDALGDGCTRSRRAALPACMARAIPPDSTPPIR